MCFTGRRKLKSRQLPTKNVAGAAKWLETNVKISHLCFRGARKLKAADFYSKSRGSSQMVRNHSKNQPYVLQGRAEA